jgi:hypothetical protein
MDMDPALVLMLWHALDRFFNRPSFERLLALGRQHPQ